MYTIGQLACLEGVTPKTLRHYEKLELLMPSAHSDSGYRLYSEEDRQKLHEILYYRDLGFPLKAVGEMLRSAEGERRELIEEQISHLGNTNRRCENLRTELLDIREKEKGHGEKTALLIVDMQRDFLENSPLSTPRTARAAENIRKLLDGIRGLGIPVVYICDCHSESDPELCHWPKHTMKGTAGAEIIDILAPAAEDKVFYKNSFNAFSSGELNPYLHENRVSRLIVTGVHTTICITETVMRAYYLGYDTVVPQECVEAYSDEEQLFGLNQLRSNYQTRILSTEELLRELQDARQQNPAWEK